MTLRKRRLIETRSYDLHKRIRDITMMGEMNILRKDVAEFEIELLHAPIPQQSVST